MVVAFVGLPGGDETGVRAGVSFCAQGHWRRRCERGFTFLPSFLFILAGGPLVESTHGQLRFTAPLSAITAAVVGVIVNLAVFFAYHVLWPQGFSAPVDWVSLLIGAAATIALFRFKVGVIPVILACGLAGLAITLLR